MFEDLRITLNNKAWEVLNLDPDSEDSMQVHVASNLGRFVNSSGHFMQLDPDHIILFLFTHLYILVTPFIGFFLIACTLISYTLDFGDIISLIHLAMLLFIVTVTQVQLLFARRHLGAYFVKKLQLKSTRGQRQGKDTSTREKLRVLFTKYWPPCIWICWFIYMITHPLYNYFVKSKAFVLPFAMWFPFDIHNITGFLVAFVFELFAVNCFCQQISTTVPGYLYIASIMVDEQITLINSIRKLHEDTVSEFLTTQDGDFRVPKGSYDLYRDPKFLKCLVRRFNQIIHNHQVVCSMFIDLQEITGIVLFAVESVGGTVLAAAGCIIISDYSDLNVKLTLVAVIIVNLGIAIILCVLGQEIINSGEKVREELYFTNWYDWPESMKRSLRIMLAKTLEPPTLTSAFILTKLNLETFAVTLNAAYSLMNLLRAFQQ